jgi:phage terminase large subunit
VAAVAEATQRALDAWAESPPLFAEQVLGLQVWERQREILTAPLRGKRTSTRSGHKIGKSTSIAALGLWFSLFVPRCQVILTSSSGRQVKDILWRELARLRRESRIPLGGDWHDLPSSGLNFRDGRRIIGFATDEQENMAGFSGDNLVFLVDEASGVPD